MVASALGVGEEDDVWWLVAWNVVLTLGLIWALLRLTFWRDRWPSIRFDWKGVMFGSRTKYGGSWTRIIRWWP